MLKRIALFYVVTLLASGLLNAGQEAIGLSPDLIQLVQFGPALGVAVILLCHRSTTVIAARTAPAGEVATRCGVVLVVAGAAMLGAVAIHCAFGRDLHGFWDEGLPFPLWALVLTMTIGSLGEEIGWRAWLQPYLQTRYSVLTSSVLVGVLWGMWHVSGWAAGPAYMAIFVVMAVAMSVTLGALLRSARGANLAVATAMHTAANLLMIGLFDEEDGATFPLVAMAAAWVVAAIITHVVTRPGGGAAHRPADQDHSAAQGSYPA